MMSFLFKHPEEYFSLTFMYAQGCSMFQAWDISMITLTQNFVASFIPTRICVPLAILPQTRA